MGLVSPTEAYEILLVEAQSSKHTDYVHPAVSEVDFITYFGEELIDPESEEVKAFFLGHPGW